MPDNNLVTLELTRSERSHLWGALDRVLAGQPVQDNLTSLRWIRDRIAKQCYAEVEGLDLSGDRAEVLKNLKGGR